MALTELVAEVVTAFALTGVLSGNIDKRSL
jgi:hypothetical protein